MTNLAYASLVTEQQPGAHDESGLRYDSAPQRRRTILSAVSDSGFVSVTELTQRLGVSDMTVRRDLRKLAHQGKVRIVHGGVSALTTSLHSAAFTGRAEEHAAGKRAIGEAVARSLSLRATVAVDAGTSTYAAVQALPDTFRGTVVTHSIPVMQLLLTRGIGGVVGLGGELLPASQAFVGPRTVEAVAGLRVQTLLLGAAAVDDRGVYVATDNERPDQAGPDVDRRPRRPARGLQQVRCVGSGPPLRLGRDHGGRHRCPAPGDILARQPGLASILEVAVRDATA